MKTATRIEREQWKTFLDNFSRQYQGREVTVSLMSSHIVALRRTGVAQLDGVWIEEQNSQLITMMVTLELSEHGVITHTISAPTFLSWDENQGILFIELADGSTELLQLHRSSG